MGNREMGKARKKSERNVLPAQRESEVGFLYFICAGICLAGEDKRPVYPLSFVFA